MTDSSLTTGAIAAELGTRMGGLTLLPSGTDTATTAKTHIGKEPVLGAQKEIRKANSTSWMLLKELEIERVKTLSREDAINEYREKFKFSEFRSKEAAILFMLKLPVDSNAQIFARDIPGLTTNSKTFFCAIPKRIYQKSVQALERNEPEYYYEWIGKDMKIQDPSVKCGVDLDMEGVAETRTFDEDIVWVAAYINEAVEKRYQVHVDLEQWVVLKCDYDPIKRKFSAHLILHCYKWPTVEARKQFLDSIGLVEAFALRCPEAKTPLKVVDKGVFGVKFLRLLKSTKTGKNLPLWGARLPGMMAPTDDFQFFLKSMTTYTVDCQLLEGDPNPIDTPVSIASSSMLDKSSTLDTVDSVARSSRPAYPKLSIVPSKRFVPPWDIITLVLSSLDTGKRCAEHTYESWAELGWCVSDLARRADKVQEGRQAWVDFCRRDPKAFNEEKALEIYDKARSDGKVFGWSSMMKWLAEDDPMVHEAVKTRLKEISRQQASSSRNDVEYVISRGGSDTSFARLLVERSNGVYVASNSRGAPNLLKFDMYWRREADKLLVVDILELVPEFDRKLVECNMENLEVSDGGEDDLSHKEKKKALAHRRKQIQSCISRLESNGHKNSIVREFAAIVFKDRFESSLDGADSAHLLCFEDGVYDLNIGAWRDAAPEDMISVCTNYPLRGVPVDYEVRESIKSVLFAPFVNEEVALSRMVMNAAALNGAINFKKVLIDTGSKNNGKSSQNEFFADTLGDYALTLPNSVLTTRIDAGKPFPELDRAKKARCALVKDFESGHKILPGNFKALSGGDKQATRGLWANIDEWRPRFQLRIACNNDLPEFQNNGGGDEGILTRLLMYHFTKRFSENPRSQNELPLDRSLPAKLASLEWKQQYMLWLLDLYRDYRLADGFLPAFPQEVIEVTNRYKSDVDSLRAFIDERLRLDRDKKDPHFIVKKKALYDFYKENRKEGVLLLDSVKFSRQMMCMLEDNYRDGKSFRDQYYFGLELVPKEPDSPQSETRREERANQFLHDD